MCSRLAGAGQLSPLSDASLLRLKGATHAYTLSNWQLAYVQSCMASDCVPSCGRVQKSYELRQQILNASNALPCSFRVHQGTTAEDVMWLLTVQLPHNSLHYQLENMTREMGSRRTIKQCSTRDYHRCVSKR